MTILPDDQSRSFDESSGLNSPNGPGIVPDNEAKLSPIDSDTTPPSSPPTTLADALVFVRRHDVMAGRKLEDAISAVKVLEKVTGLKADQLPTQPEHLGPIIERAMPARYRIWPKHWQNAVSSIRALLRACGLHAARTTGKPTDPAWVAHLSTMPTKWESQALLPFGRWCSDVGTKPEDVTEQSLERYAHYRRTSTIRTYVTQHISAIRIIWNRCVRARLPGWPSRLLIAPRHPNVEALPLGCFPISLQEELAAYLLKRTEPDAFDADHQRWRPATAREVRRFLIRAASLIAQRLGGPEHVKSLADIVTADAVEFVLRHIYERSGHAWRGHAANFASYLLLVARDFVRVDAATVARIEELRGVIIKRLREQRKPGLSERVNERLMPFDDPKILRRLFLLPDELYRMAKRQLDAKSSPRPVRAAQLSEQAVMLDLLRHDQMRRHDLASLNYLEDFKRDDKGRINRLWVSGDRTKNGIAIDTPIPPDLAKHLQNHWTVHRIQLRGSHSPWLFPSPKGEPRAPDNVTKTLGRVVERMLGVKFTPHMIRHIVATLLYRIDPHNGVVVQRKLRHTNIKTTERKYGQMSNAGSNAVWQRELDQFRRAKVSAARRTKRKN